MLIFSPKNGNLTGMISLLLEKGRKSFFQIDATEINPEYDYYIERIYDRKPGTHYGSIQSESLGQYVNITFSQQPVLVTAYTLYSQTGSNCYPTSWDFAVSNDNTNWTIVDKQRDTNILEPDSAIVFTLENPVIARYFSWINKGIDKCKHYAFYLNEIELFGNLSPLRGFLCSSQCKYFLSGIHFHICFISFCF